MAEALPTATAFGRVQAGSKTMEPPSDEDDAAVVGELVGGLPLSAFHIRLWLVCAISYGACGSTGALLPWLIASMREQLHLDVVQEGAISSCIYWGMMVGSVVGGQLADEVGRRRAVIGCLALLTLLQLSLSALSSTLLIGASFFMRGMVYIAVENVSKAQLAECVPSARRGLLLNAPHMVWQLGAMIGTTYTYGTTGYRPLAVISAFGPLVALAYSVIFCVETPMWLLRAKGRDAAEESLKMFTRKCHAPPLPDPLFASRQIAECSFSRQFGECSFSRQFPESPTQPSHNSSLQSSGAGLGGGLGGAHGGGPGGGDGGGLDGGLGGGLGGEL
eukprot:CAMPEP_0179949346 /NCGR_PEP_ID=MMETSP0983-20121128/22281_1 /TAXON_ID=483367 /ORGANISM="non described non described, Strain CCMP 2436" /LENGTH=332 /DNA_ID=CAMNT_0021859069 /DNA_START=1 /DNA_END=995 /DNA_ORIENTATION=+